MGRAVGVRFHLCTVHSVYTTWRNSKDEVHFRWLNFNKFMMILGDFGRISRYWCGGGGEHSFTDSDIYFFKLSHMHVSPFPVLQVFFQACSFTRGSITRKSRIGLFTYVVISDKKNPSLVENHCLYPSPDTCLIQKNALWHCTGFIFLTGAHKCG